MSRYALHVGIGTRALDDSYATLDAAIVRACELYRSCRQSVYVRDSAERDPTLATRGMVTDRGWRFVRKCHSCAGTGINKAAVSSCPKCDGKGFRPAEAVT